VKSTTGVLIAAILLSSMVSAANPSPGSAAACPWMNTSLSPAKRAHMLVGAMTLDQKIAMVHNSDEIWTYYGVAGHINAIPELCVPDVVLNDAGQGVGDQMQGTTAFPAPIAQTASWDRDLQQQFGRHLGHQAWQKGVNVQLAPGLNIGRVPLNGRNWEYMGEDPYLTGQTAAAEVRGIQSQHVIATLKHYALNNQETDRNTSSSEVDQRTFREIYLPGWETAIREGHPGAVMCSYNRIDTVYACENPDILTRYLKKQSHFKGFVVSDWGATHSTVPSAKAGLDMDMNAFDDGFYGDALKTAVQNGDVSMKRLNNMVFRIFLSMFRIGLFDHPTPAQPGAAGTTTDTAAEQEFARKVSEGGTVLMKNDGHILPLPAGGGHVIALIGRNAGPDGTAQVYNGGGSGHIPEAGTKPDVVSPVQGMQTRAATAGDVVTFTDGSNMQDAVAAATAADIAIVFAYNVSGEGTDLPSLSLNDGSGNCAGLACSYQASQQNQLIAAVAAANPDTVVVLNTAGPVLTPWRNSIKGLIEAWFPGEQDGNAIARILYGDVNPSGKLPQTFPRQQADLPTAGSAAQYPGINGHVKYTEKLLVGYRWYDAKNIAPAFCFGQGLSYTTFGYSGLSVVKTARGAKVTFTIRNNGTRAGAEVPQVYLGFPSTTGEPPKQLKGFEKVALAPGSSRQITIQLDQRAFAWWSTGSASWVVTLGNYQVMVGSSSCDIRLNGTVKM
jgi:beta-glucosidase